MTAHEFAASLSGFTQPWRDAQASFRDVMTALSRPGAPRLATVSAAAPEGVAPAAWGALLALADADAPVWLSPELDRPDIRDALQLYASTRIAPVPSSAAFALVDVAADGLDLSCFAQGDPRYPDRSATVLAQCPALGGGEALRLSGPGLKEPVAFAPQGLPDDFPAQWARQRSSYPLGVDLLLVSGEWIAGLPRSIDVTRVVTEKR